MVLQKFYLFILFIYLSIIFSVLRKIKTNTEKQW